MLACAYLLSLAIIPTPGLQDAAVLVLALFPAARSFHSQEGLHPGFATFFLVRLYALIRVMGAL